MIPGNDDAIRSINLISRLIADAILEGKGEDEVQAEDRPVPPVIEEAQVSEEVAEEAPTANGTGGEEAVSEEAVPGVEEVEVETSVEDTPAEAPVPEPAAAEEAPAEPTEAAGTEDEEEES